jgi:hypothetical protein
VPIAFAPLVGIALGAVFAWVAAPVLVQGDGPITLSRPFFLVATFAALLWLPIVAYFVAFHGDWSYLYLVPWPRIPSAIDLGLVLLSAAALPVGFGLAARPVRRQHLVPVAVLVVAPGALVVAGLALAAQRIAVSGSYAQFHGEFGTEPIGASTLGKGVLLMGTVLALGIGWTVRSLVRMGGEG